MHATGNYVQGKENAYGSYEPVVLSLTAWNDKQG